MGQENGEDEQNQNESSGYPRLVRRDPPPTQGPFQHYPPNAIPHSTPIYPQVQIRTEVPRSVGRIESSGYNANNRNNNLKVDETDKPKFTSSTSSAPSGQIDLADIWCSDVVEKIATYLCRHEMCEVPRVCKSWRDAVGYSQIAIDRALPHTSTFFCGGQVLASLAPLFDEEEGYVFKFRESNGLELIDAPNVLTRAYTGCQSSITGDMFFWCRAFSNTDLGEGYRVFDRQKVEIWRFSKTSQGSSLGHWTGAQEGTLVPNCSDCRPHHAVLAFQNHIVVCGGTVQEDNSAPPEEEQGLERSCASMCIHLIVDTEQYGREITGDELWAYEPDMFERRSHAGDCVIGNTGYVIGGCYVINEEPAQDSVELPRPLQVTHKSCEKLYYPSSSSEDKSWKYMAEMSHARCKMPAVVYKNEIWVTGGQGEDRATISSVEIYNPESDIWREGPSLNRVRQDHTAFVHHGKLFVAGGQFSTPGNNNVVLRPVPQIEVYDEKLKAWRVLQATMPSVISIFSAGRPVTLPWVGWNEGYREEADSLCS